MPQLFVPGEKQNLHILRIGRKCDLRKYMFGHWFYRDTFQWLYITQYIITRTILPVFRLNSTCFFRLAVRKATRTIKNAPSTAWSMSASPKTMKGAFPPASMDILQRQRNQLSMQRISCSISILFQC